MITLEGYITAFEIAPASVDDREGIRDLAENQFGLVVLGDKGYTGKALWDDMRRQGICLMSLKPSSYKTNWPAEIRRLIFGFRGLCTRLQNKVLGHNLCMAFNSISCKEAGQNSANIVNRYTTGLALALVFGQASPLHLPVMVH